MLINLLVLYLFLMEFKNKYCLIKSLCEIIWNISKIDEKTGQSNTDLFYYNRELVAKVNEGFKTWESIEKHETDTVNEEIESKRIYVANHVLNDLFRRKSNYITFLSDFYHLDNVYEEKMGIPGENLEYITALIMFYHITHEKNIILSNTSLAYCEILSDELFREYKERFEIVPNPRRNLKQGKKLVFDPFKYLGKKDGFVLDLGKFKCFQEELPDSIKQMGL